MEHKGEGQNKREELQGTDIRCERNVQGTDITRKKECTGDRGQIAVCKIEITLVDITSHCLLSSSQEPSKCLFEMKEVDF